ncbi:hypothetical protein [Virgibacillus ihumii]|uniref:hypothetical protein n=1 Tax=Virgibacillus ihumii TaxID=2686091 RepID=UPI00157CDD20|nr:hypothetical protein [Virgibacillus ihumii]
MNPLIKFGLFIFVLLFIISMHKDLTVGSLEKDLNHSSEDNITSRATIHSQAVRIKVHEGETVLSIVEQINQESVQTLDVKQIVADFKELNPDAKPLQIKAGNYYFFPFYEKGAGNF